MRMFWSTWSPGAVPARSPQILTACLPGAGHRQDLGILQQLGRRGPPSGADVQCGVVGAGGDT